MVKIGKICSILGIFVLFSGCVATQSYDALIGDGRLNLSDRTWSAFQRYKAEFNGSAFVYNPRTQHSYYLYCPEAQCAVSDKAKEAIYRCELKAGKGCKLFAQGKTIVWRGPVYVSGAIVHHGRTPAPSPDRVSVPAKYRIVGASGPSEWKVGKIHIKETNQENTFEAEFHKSVYCDGVIAGAPRFSSSEKYSSSLVGNCSFGRSVQPFSEFKGRLNVVSKGTGHINATDDQDRKTEIVFRSAP